MTQDPKMKHPIFRKPIQKRKTPRKPKDPNAPKQLRGEELQTAIKAAIEKLAAAAEANGKDYVYIASHVAKEVPCTRKSLDNHGDFIQDILDDMGSNRRARDGGVMIEALRNRIALLEKRNKELEEENQALAAENINIYDTLSLQSVPAATLLRKTAISGDTVVTFPKPKT